MKERLLVQSRVSSGNPHPYVLKSQDGKVSIVRLLWEPQVGVPAVELRD
jgi:hypothetical protein